MKFPQMRLVQDYSFENIFGEVITIKRGTTFTVLADDAYTQPSQANLLWTIGKNDVNLIKIPKVFLAPYDGEKVRRAIARKNNS